MTDTAEERSLKVCAICHEVITQKGKVEIGHRPDYHVANAYHYKKTKKPTHDNIRLQMPVCASDGQQWPCETMLLVATKTL